MSRAKQMLCIALALIITYWAYRVLLPCMTGAGDSQFGAERASNPGKAVFSGQPDAFPPLDALND